MNADRLDRALDTLLRDLEPGDDGAEVATARLLVQAVKHGEVSPRRADIRRTVLTGALQRGPRRRMRWLVVVPTIALVAFGGVAFAARSALPGSALYPVRRGLQAVRVAVSFGDHAKAVALLDRAERDVDDAARLFREGNSHDARDALETFGHDLAAARAEIGRLGPADRPALASRADALAARAASLGSVEDRGDRGTGGSGSDDASRSGSGGSGSDGSGSDGSGSSGSGSSGSGKSAPGSDDSGSGGGGSGSDDGSSGSGKSTSGGEGSGSSDGGSGGSGGGSGSSGRSD